MTEVTGFPKLSLAISALALGAIGLLELTGPFFDPLCPSEAGPFSTDYVPGDGYIKTDAGVENRYEGWFTTTGRAGNLVFGPWMTLPAGQYEVEWQGNVRSVSFPHFAVASSNGVIVKAQAFPLEPVAGAAALVKIKFDLPTETRGVEFPVTVREGDAMAIHDVRLTTFSCVAR